MSLEGLFMTIVPYEVHTGAEKYLIYMTPKFVEVYNDLSKYDERLKKDMRTALQYLKEVVNGDMSKYPKDYDSKRDGRLPTIWGIGGFPSSFPVDCIWSHPELENACPVFIISCGYDKDIRENKEINRGFFGIIGYKDERLASAENLKAFLETLILFKHPFTFDI
jgi:hypothetical protein